VSSFRIRVSSLHGLMLRRGTNLEGG